MKPKIHEHKNNSLNAVSKAKTGSITIIFLATILLSSCYKTYTCQCTDPTGVVTATTGQVKATSAKKAEKRCSGGCSGGTTSVK
jgi:hypothetical protein